MLQPLCICKTSTSWDLSGKLIDRSQLHCRCHCLLWSAMVMAMTMFLSFLELAGMSRHLKQGSCRGLVHIAILCGYCHENFSNKIFFISLAHFYINLLYCRAARLFLKSDNACNKGQGKGREFPASLCHLLICLNDMQRKRSFVHQRNLIFPHLLSWKVAEKMFMLYSLCTDTLPHHIGYVATEELLLVCGHEL
jgi:hypothetical protein